MILHHQDRPGKFAFTAWSQWMRRRTFFWRLPGRIFEAIHYELNSLMFAAWIKKMLTRGPPHWRDFGWSSCNLSSCNLRL